MQVKQQQTAETDWLHTETKDTRQNKQQQTCYTHRERKSGCEVVRDNGYKSNNSRQLRLTGYTHRDNGYETKPTADLLHTQRKKEWV